MLAHTSVIGNTGFLGVPMLIVLLGPPAIGPVLMVLALDLVVFSTLITLIIAAARHGRLGPGTVLPVIDLAVRLGMPPIEGDERNVIMVVSINGQTAGLLVDAVSDILAVATSDLQPPPDLAADIVDRGVMLSGGGAMLGEMDLALREQTGLMISLADQPMSCVALGTGKALEYEKQLRHVIDYDS